jgi:hypothetical protein
MIKTVACGDNYSAIISRMGKLLVTGDLEGGKLGLGKQWLTGKVLSFREV